MATAERHAACLHVSGAMRAACRRAGCAEKGGSVGGPKPGRASFYGELGGAEAVRASYGFWSLGALPTEAR